MLRVAYQVSPGMDKILFKIRAPEDENSTFSFFFTDEEALDVFNMEIFGKSKIMLPSIKGYACLNPPNEDGIRSFSISYQNNHPGLWGIVCVPYDDVKSAINDALAEFWEIQGTVEP